MEHILNPTPSTNTHRSSSLLARDKLYEFSMVKTHSSYEIKFILRLHLVIIYISQYCLICYTGQEYKNQSYDTVLIGPSLPPPVTKLI